jgi:hypothetical protein
MITGLYSCSCHPFSSWKESDLHHKRKFKIGDPVRHRCKGIRGTVYKIWEERGFYTVKYGDYPRDQHLEHAGNLEPTSMFWHDKLNLSISYFTEKQ